MSQPENRKLVGLHKETEDASTGSPAAFHRVGTITLDRLAGTCFATVASYVSKEKFGEGKGPVNFLGQQTFDVTTEEAMPAGLDLDSFVLLQVAAKETDVYGNPNPFYGAEPVYAD